MTQRFPVLFLVLLASLFILNLFQSSLTELIYDEAYYWYYSQDMAWGYFDHPPMVAFLIKIGNFFLEGELGVRLMSCFLSVGTYVLLWLMIDNPRKQKHSVVFFLLLFSFTLMNAYGFLILPDTPLLFFTAFFLFLYKRFLNQPSYPLAIGIGIIMAALMYSKYHAVLVILFVLLSNLKLLRDTRAWVAVGVALLCYVPHFVWLYDHDFVSIKYHILERPNQAYSFTKFTLGYFVNLIAIFGLVFFWVYKALIKTKTSDLFIRALKFLAYGVLIFFFISSFNRRVQTQWVIIVSIPLAILTFNHILENSNSRKWVYRMGWISLIIMLYARSWLIYKPLFPVVFETHGNKKWVNELKEKSEGVPIVFENSYRRAPMYEFYSGIPAFTLNNHMYRRNQYTIDDSEERMRNKRILYVTKFTQSGDINYLHPDGKTVIYGNFIDDFESFRKLRCIVEKKPSSDEYLMKVYNPYSFEIPMSKLSFSAAFSNDYKQVKDLRPLHLEDWQKAGKILAPKDTLAFSFQLPPTKMENPKYFRVGISENGLRPGLNGNPFEIE